MGIKKTYVPSKTISEQITPLRSKVSSQENWLMWNCGVVKKLIFPISSADILTFAFKLQLDEAKASEEWKTRGSQFKDRSQSSSFYIYRRRETILIKIIDHKFDLDPILREITN